MKFCATILPSYAADTSGVCSALYELGGLTIVHDASGCNSTYSTFDEPRWYSKESLIVISGLTEMQAILGDDACFVSAITHEAQLLKPAFLTICGSPMPRLIGTDFEGIAEELQRDLHLPVISIPTNGIQSYLVGCSQALQAVASHFAKDDSVGFSAQGPWRINILGATPLDLTSITANALTSWVASAGFRLNCCLAMGCSLKEVEHLGCAHVNLVVSASGYALALDLKERFGTPFVVGLPFGKLETPISEALCQAAQGRDVRSPLSLRGEGQAKALIIGESVQAASLACALYLEEGLISNVYSPLDVNVALLSRDRVTLEDEEDLRRQIGSYTIVLADPLYAPLVPPSVRFLPFAHLAFSGRLALNHPINLYGATLRSHGFWEQSC